MRQAPAPTSRIIAVGVLTGLFSGLTGVGGGALVVTLMVSWLGMSQHLAQGTTPSVIIPVALFGALTYAAQGLAGQFRFDTVLALQVIPALAFPSIAGVFIGATWMAHLPSAQLRRAFGVFLFFVAATMLSRDLLPGAAAPTGDVTVPLLFWVLLVLPGIPRLMILMQGGNPEFPYAGTLWHFYAANLVLLLLTYGASHLREGLTQAHADAEGVAARDYLTGAASRRHVMAMLSRQVDRALSEGSELSVLLFDLDGFKQVNDAHGHVIGDLVLTMGAGDVTTLGPRLLEALGG